MHWDWPWRRLRWSGDVKMTDHSIINDSMPSALRISFKLLNEEETLQLGRTLATVCSGGAVIYLQGTLGMGKTTLSRGLLLGLGYDGKVKSPTYTIVEPYEWDELNVYHFDLYRLDDPEELELMGARDYFSDASLCLVEWPERGEGWIPGADLDICFERAGNGRQLWLSACTEKGREMLLALQKQPLPFSSGEIA